jgi:hypothetical protein
VIEWSHDRVFIRLKGRQRTGGAGSCPALWLALAVRGAKSSSRVLNQQPNSMKMWGSALEAGAQLLRVQADASGCGSHPGTRRSEGKIGALGFDRAGCEADNADVRLQCVLSPSLTW